MPGKNTRPIHGIVLLDKPQGLSSNQALQKVKRLFRADKAGHTGSLDPMATGLLPVCLGEATKLAGLLLGSDKAYVADCLLGVTTTTDDAEGEVLRRREVPHLDDAAIGLALQRFVGEIEQVPPAYSALKRDGVPMYVRARRGEQVEQAARRVHVRAVELEFRDGSLLRLHVQCGTGTYIRALARDLGEVLGCGAHLTALRRLWVTPFRAPRMFTLEALHALAETGPDALARALLPLETGLSHVPELKLDAAQCAAVEHGRAITVEGTGTGLHRVHAGDGRLLALVERETDGSVRVRRGFRLPPRKPEGDFH